MNELITIIIPVYDVEAYLHHCVDSVIRQTYENLEIILVDDGSPDRCGGICDDYARIDKRIQVIHKQNGGISDARNAGLDLAHGEYISLLDSDDWVHEEFIEKLHNLIKATDSEIAIADFIMTSTESISIDAANIEIHEFTNIEALQKLNGELNLRFVVAWGKLYHKRIFNIIRYPVGKAHEDEYTAHKILYEARKIVYTTEKLLYYRQRPDSFTGGGFKLKNRIHVIHALIDRADFFNDIGLYEERDITYSLAFYYLKECIKYIDKNCESIDRAELLREFKDLKFKIRKGNYSFKYKAGCELYYLFPFISKRGDGS
ncbi:MAG TPA: glycosyltransferase family 2 protein [Syntrophomonadaceae bacterium]|nr:glycosyltransferase family 2 protein [Syntrophomonadaceae bacterium]HPR94571.1 glycosyltransferase family 2 protein [Syntrophomonadaceae bacterium]